MITIEDVCTYLNKHVADRPAFMLPVLRTLWHLDSNDVPDDIEVYVCSSGTHAADLIGILNGMFAGSGQRIVGLSVAGTIQYVVENEKMQTT